MIDELETITANIKKAQGLVSDAQIAVEKLPSGAAVDNLLDAIESTRSELEWVLHYLLATKEELRP